VCIVNYACADLLHHENCVEMACRSKTPAKALSDRIKTRHQLREESMESSRESCRQSSREEGKAPSINYSAAKVAHYCCLCFSAAMRKYIELANQKRKPRKTSRSDKEDPLGGQMLVCTFSVVGVHLFHRSLINTKWLESLQEILSYTILESGYIIVKYRPPVGTGATAYIYLMLFQEEARYLPTV